MYVDVFSPPDSLGHQGEDTFYSEPQRWLARAPRSTGTSHQTCATGCSKWVLLNLLC